ncbi:hypothetical protein D3C71_1285580 [compost metagenome]
MQHAFTLGNRQLVIRAGKVVHADKLVASLCQRSDGFLQDIQLLLRRGQVSIFDFALGGKQRRQVRVVKNAQAVRIQLSHAFQSEGEAFRRLLREAVNQVDIRGSKSDFARVVQQRKNKFLILLAIDQALNLFVKVLHAHAQAIKALGSQVIEYIQLDFTRIDFNRDFSIGLKTEVGPQKIHQTADLRFVEIGWRTAAPVKLTHVAASHQRCTMQDFLL